MDVLRDEIRALEQELSLQKASWLYSHHRLYSICFGILYGAITGGLHYVILGLLTHTERSIGYDSPLLYGFAGSVLMALFLIVIFGIPTIAFLPMLLMLKAPRFALRSMFFYVVSFLFFSSLFLYIDPWFVLISSIRETDRTSSVASFAILQTLALTFLILFAPQIAQRCGYRHVLDGSTLSFEINANIAEVSKQLEEVEEDFNLTLDRARSRPNAFFFFRGSRENKKMVLQIFLRPEDDKTNLLVVMHSIVNDVPIKTKPAIVERLGGALMRWLEVSRGFTVLATQNKSLTDEIIKESKESFYRQSVGLPSRKVVRDFLRDHWKDIVIIISAIVAFLSWVFPFR